MLPIKTYLKQPSLALLGIVQRLFFLFPDRIYLRILFRLSMGRRLNLNHPSTFSEKLQWLKIYDRDPRYSDLVDKVAVKDYVAGVIGKKYIIPTLGVWDNPNEIEWDSLPNKFVLKTTHGGGSSGVIICHDKDSFNINKAVAFLSRGMKQNIWGKLREWPYKNVKPRIIAEQFIESDNGLSGLPDYKWYCFNGNPVFCQVIQDRKVSEKIDFFDKEWAHQSFSGLHPYLGPVFGSAGVLPSRPELLETHISIAKTLSKGIPFSRIDLYDTGREVLFGEITFYPMSGLGVFYPEEFNTILGDMIELPHQL